MDRNVGTRLACVVCGLDTKRHTGWFLVMENRWLDRLRILAWHPLVARQTRMQSVCGEEHLRTLLTHWLAYANLQFLATGSSKGTGSGENEVECGGTLVGKVVGELAVQRESASRVWTGSPEAMECILDALMRGLDAPSDEPTLPLLERRTLSFEEYALN